MNDAAWIALLDTLPPQHRELAQHIMARITFVLNHDRGITLDDVQRVERRLELVQREFEALNARLDEWDGSRSQAVGER